MSVNSSSTSNYLYFCTHGISMYMYNAIAALRTILLLPLSTFILYLGHQRWRQHRSSKAATHSDIFTYNVAAMELIWVLGSFCLCAGIYSNHFIMITVGVIGCSSVYHVQTFFHILTCVERYLAVVHPITYRGLRNARGVRIRNICIGCVWLLCFGLMALVALSLPNYNPMPILCFLVFFVIIMSFCSLSVLCVLIRPGPGEGGGDKQRVDQSKQRAFYTITAISVAVWLWFLGLIVSTAVDLSPQLSMDVRCVLTMSVNWLNLPGSLVSPLLYLHRAGKLACCC